MKRKNIIAAGIAAGLAAAAGAAHYKKMIDLGRVGKRVANAAKLTVPVEENYSNGVALTPPMGWASWNFFRNRISEEVIYDIGAAMKKCGLVDAGYIYLNIDDCWQSSMRDEQGRLQADLHTFPSGIKKLREDVNRLGMKLGIYSSNGTFTCEDMPASLGREAIDADTLAEWGIEYFKYDFCHNRPIPQRAPCVEKITVWKKGMAQEAEVTAEQAILKGAARVVEDTKMATGKYVAGLSGNLGSAEFYVNVPEKGEYVLTLCMRKKSSANKYIEILVNGSKKYSTTVPPTIALSKAGRHQIMIGLEAGTNGIKLHNPVASRRDSAALQYTNMGRELVRAAKEYAEKTGEPERKICYSICEWGLNFPWQWGRQAGNLWRTTMDIKPFWASVLGIYEINVKLHGYAGAGGFNDPDMLEVGNGSLTYEENKTHFTLWCMMAAPLILGNDIRAFVSDDGTVDEDNETLKIVTNRDLIAVDQDPLGKQCRRFRTAVVSDILVKPLEGKRIALCFFNKGGEERDMKVNLRSIACQSYAELPITDEYRCFELWDKTEQMVRGDLEATVPPHGVKVYIVESR
ncbi:MAG: alpha-galactosidase [Oscillospiraceae bacterium]|nr:alpha-galactosidase [Oscillospiraceae bacterium]